MQKIFSLSFCLSVGLSAANCAECPKLYQSLWPNFCNDHLVDGKGCSEIHPLSLISSQRIDSNHIRSGFAFDTFFARTDVTRSRLLEYQTLIPYLPNLQEPCAYAYCDICSRPVNKCIGRYHETPSSHPNSLVMQHECNCSCKRLHLTNENYSNYDSKTWHSCKQPTIPFAYFNRFTSQYYPFLKHHLEFCKENPPCECYWPYISALACKISDLVYDKMHDLFQYSSPPTDAWDNEFLFHHLFQNPHIPTYAAYDRERVFFESASWPTELREEFILRVLQNHFIFAFFYSNYHTIILDLCSYVDSHSPTPSHDLQKLYSALSSIRPLFLQLYSSCLENHPHPKIFYERGMIHFHNGDLFASLSDMKTFTNSIDDDTLLSSDFYLQEGTSYAELGWYDEALVALTKSIARDPQNKEAYFERASLYFETGDFERSIQDFLESGFNSTPIDVDDLSSIAFAKCLILGIGKGSTETIAHALPSLMASVNGLSHGLWAFVCDPSGCSREMVDACKDLLQFLSNSSSVELLEAFIPEIRDLHNSQSTEEQTIILGIIIGKYGTEIFAPAGLLKVYKNIRSANRVLTLQHLAKTSKESTLLQEVSTNWNKAHLESIERFKTGQATLKAYKSQFLPETTARKIIHEAGFPTFPRPKGIPDNFRIQLSDKGCGIKYIHPEHTHESIRVMPGKPHSPHLHQQKPYIVHHIKDGLAYDKYGNKVAQKSVEAHIPLEEFVYRPDALR